MNNAMTDWTSDSNEALTLSLVRSKADRQDESCENFHPSFTYPIYGEDEKLYGYDGLVIDLRFASGSLAQYLNVRYKDKLFHNATVDDVENTLAKFIPPNYYKDEAEFLKRVEEDADNFKPFGDLVFSYTRPLPPKKETESTDSKEPTPAEEDTVEFEVYHATWKTARFKEYHRQMQIFILLYIEAGSYINEEEDPWEFVVLYEKRKRRGTANTPTYHFVGYSSLYNFYCFPEKIRMRLSQFVILPPYQRKGHGSELYHALYRFVLSRVDVAELTVEDPAEAFEDLRDRNDLGMLLGHERFTREAWGEGAVSHGGGRVGRKAAKRPKVRGKLWPPVDKAWAERWRVDLKMAKRQFQRLTEMLVQNHLDPSDAPAQRAYRLQVKERLYRFNFEILAQLEKQERLEKLEETFQSVRDDYARILAMVSRGTVI